MARLTSAARQQLAAVAWLRWRIFVNSFRKKGAKGELIARAIFFPILAAFWLAPTIGSGVTGYYLVSHGLINLLPLPLWAIFFIWQLTGLNTSTTAPSFDLSSLVRFPIRYRDYLLVRLSFGLLDMPTVVGCCCLIALTIGIAVADVSLLPATALALLLYGLCNIFFSRMVYIWAERWMALRRTRELVAGLFIVLSLGLQMIGPILRRIDDQRGAHGGPNPRLLHAFHVVAGAASFLPPGLAAHAIGSAILPAVPDLEQKQNSRAVPETMQGGLFLGKRPLYDGGAHSSTSAFAIGGLALYGAFFLYVLNLRLHAQYLGENLSEAPVGAGKRGKLRAKSPQPAAQPYSLPDSASIPAATRSRDTIAACMAKDVRYLLRSGPTLYTLIMPVFMVFIFGSRSGLGANGRGGSLLFPYACAYLQIFLAAMLYNCFGGDGAGVQLYYLAPVRIRDVVISKNIVNTGILAIEIALIYLVGSFVLSDRPAAGMTAMTIAWVLFTFLVNLTGGNLRSIYAPKKIGTANIRGQRVSGLSSLISFAVLAVPIALGGGAILLCKRYENSGAVLSLTTGAFLLLAAVAFVAYIVVLGRLDRIAMEVQQDFTSELAKA